MPLIGYARVSTDDQATAAQPAWAALTDEERVGYLNRVADNIEAHAEELAYAIVREQCKPINGLGARYEIAGCVGWLRATAATPKYSSTCTGETFSQAAKVSRSRAESSARFATNQSAACWVTRSCTWSFFALIASAQPRHAATTMYDCLT